MHSSLARHAAARTAGLLIVLGVLVACSGSDRADVAAGREQDQMILSTRAHEGLCRTLMLVREGDVSGARGVFLSRSHQQLHVLASQTAERDRTVSARLLEAKAAVEESLGLAAPSVTDDVARLAEATADAITATGGIAPAPCAEPIVPKIS